MVLSLTEKAQRYLAEGSVTLIVVEPWYASGTVQGSDLYQVTLRGKLDSSCTCKAGSVGNYRCSHVMALRLVTNLDDMPHEKPKLPSYPEFDKLLESIGKEHGAL